ncbi:hypothetical protein [Photobacterium sp. J15]|uniref:hypothetical protein n=1 Tax=Photobacterium sp. J15 TaxID=265901 RepID=UPI0007E35894|nr:hypothetical protein [Photobacterium sp. J15]
MNQLTVTIDLEDYTAGLTGKLDLNGFSGYGEGWFNLSEIENFCDSLEQVVNKVEGTTKLIAGQRNLDGSEYLERLGLRCSVIAKTGVFSIHISLSDYPYTGCRPEEIRKITGEIKADTRKVLNFVSQLRKLCIGKNTEAILVANG